MTDDSRKLEDDYRVQDDYEDTVVEYAASPKMQLPEVVQKYGELKEIVMSEIEAREYAAFAQQPVGIQLLLMADDGMAGVYGEEERTTTRYSPSAHVFSISINGM